MSTVFKKNDIVQLIRCVIGGGDVGIVIGPTSSSTWTVPDGCLDVLFSYGITPVHPSNLQIPDTGDSEVINDNT